MRVITALNQILADHAGTRVNGRVASERTKSAAGEALRAIFRRLYELGYKLEDPTKIGERHIAALCDDWHERELAPKTMQGYLSQLRIFCGWIGKKGLVKTIEHYLPHVPPDELRVNNVAEKSKSWAENGVDVIEKALEAKSLDRRFYLMILLQVGFGLRRMEVLQMIPWKVDKGNRFAVYQTKGGRPRDVDIVTEVQRELLDYVKSQCSKNGRVGWMERIDGKAWKGDFKEASFKYSVNRYDHLMGRLGISRATTNCTGHGLRAQYAENAALIKGLIPPTLGGTPGQMDREDMNVLRSQVSESLGHSRVSITSPYYGSFGRAGALDEPGRAKENIAACMLSITIDPTTTIPENRFNDCLQLLAELARIQVIDDPRKIEVLWAYHSRRHATDWLAPSKDMNLAALEAAAISITRGSSSGSASAVSA